MEFYTEINAKEAQHSKEVGLPACSLEGTEDIFEGTEEFREGTKEKVESTDGQVKGTEDQTEEEIATQTPTSMIFGDDETISKVLLNMSKAKAVSKEKEKGVELKDVEETDRPRPTSTRSLLTLKPLPKIDPKDKGKKKIEEEDESESESDGISQAEKKFKQLESDEELARKVQEEWEAEEERNKIAEENAANEDLIRDFDDMKVRIEADRLLAKKLQEQEREQFTIEERAKFLHDTIAAQRKFLAQQRSEAIRNKPPTKNQLRNQMMTYLKHVGNYKHAELKIKKFEEVHALYEKIKRSDEDFISIGSAEDEKLIKKMNEKGVSLSKSEVIKEESKEEVQKEDKDEESTRKRKFGTRKKIKSRKRRYIQYTSEDDSDKENDELRLYLTVAQDEEKEVDYEILDRKYPIKEWKTECLGAKPQSNQAEHFEEINLNVVIRSNGQKRYFSTLMTVLSILDREYLNVVYQLVMDEYQNEMPEGFDRVLRGDLMVLFNSDDKDMFWSSQKDWKVVSWKLHSSSGVHTLVADTGLIIHMLVEKKYPLRKEVLKQMLKLKLESKEENTMALHKNWLVHKQTACGKDFSNPFMVDNLPKIVGLSTHLASVVKSWLVHDQTVHALASPKANELTIPEQTATVAEKTKLLLKKDRVYKFKKTTSAVDLKEFCEKHYKKLLPIMADKYEYEKRKKEKLEEVKARLDFGDNRKKSTRAQESAYSKSRTISPRRQRRSRSPRHNPSVFTRLRRERSRLLRHEYKSKERRGSTVFAHCAKHQWNENQEHMYKEQTNFQGSTAHIPPPVNPILIPKPDVSKTLPKLNIPYPSRRNDQKFREKASYQKEKIFQMFQDLRFDISFADALFLMPRSAPTIRNLLMNKESCLNVCHALADLGASINLMPLSIWKKLSLPELTPTRMTLELADRSITHPKGLAEDVYVKVGKFHFPTDFVVVDFEADPRVPLILGRSFLRTSRALIDVYGEEITLRVDNEAITFNLDQTTRYSSTNDKSVNRIDIIDEVCEEYAPELLGFSNKSSGGNPTPTSEPLTSEFILEEIEAYLKDDSISPEIDHADCNPEGDICLIEKLLNNDPFQLPPMDLKQGEIIKAKSSMDNLHELGGLKDDEKDALLKVLKSHKRAIAWKITDIKGIDPRFCTHKILMEDDYKPTVQSQRRVNPKIHEVIKKEVLKLLDAGMIYPISDSPWVSPVHCVPKKGGITVVANEENELILTRLVTGWILGLLSNPDRSLRPRENYFHMPFMELSRTIALCNALGTFQRCMMAIFHDMIEKTMEVFMDDFSIFRDSFSSCLSNLDKMLKRCEDTNLVLNWEKCHFMRREGIMLGHKISKFGIEVDRAKVDVIAKLRHPTTVKGVRSFLGHGGFYRRFIQDFSKIARPMTHLLEKETPFVFSKDCIDVFETLKKKFTEALILVVPDWNQPLELMCDASDFAIGAVLGQRESLNIRRRYIIGSIAQDQRTTTKRVV
ncbi:reverse transcriptase domain-containing protein [Tanacetum coccineum]